MCELLIKAIDATNADADKDQRGCYKRGMVVVVAEDGHEWGKEECPPKFLIIKVPDTEKSKLDKYIAPHVVREGFEKDGVTPKMVTHRRRLWIIDLDSLQKKDLDMLKNTGTLSVKTSSSVKGADMSWGNFKQLIKNQNTGIVETEEL